FCSMCRHLNLCALCAVITIYGPSSCPMCRHLNLWTVILPYVPSSQSMDRHPALCAVISIYVPYVPSSRSMDRRPHSMCRPPTAIHCTTSANHRTPTKKGSISFLFLCFIFYFY